MTNTFAEQLTHNLKICKDKSEVDNFKKEKGLKNLRTYQNLSKKPKKNLKQKLQDNIQDGNTLKCCDI